MSLKRQTALEDMNARMNRPSLLHGRYQAFDDGYVVVVEGNLYGLAVHSC